MVRKIIFWVVIGLTVFVVNVGILFGLALYAATADQTVYLGSGYEYSEEYLFIECPNRGEGDYIKYVPPQILNYNYDENHIIAKQSPKGEFIDMWYFEGSGRLYDFDHGYNFDYYWIIDKKKHEVCGPYDYEEFKKKCDEMGVKVKFNKKLF